MTGVALACLALLAYTYLGYPVLIALLARGFPMRLRRDADYEPSVSVLIPVFNAEAHVGPKLESLLALDYPMEKLEILVYSDASSDGSDRAVEAFAARHADLHLLRADRRSGKPAGINRMLETASGEVLLMTDIRQPLDPGALRALVAPLADPSVGAVSGNLVLRGRSGAGLYWRYERWLRHSEGTFRSMVGVTGAIYTLRRRDLEPLPTDIILDDMWVPLKLRLRRMKIVFEERAVAHDDAFQDPQEFQRKVRTLAGNYQLFARLPRLLVPVLNPSFFEFMSHKVFRLLCPWALLALAAVSIAGVGNPLLALLALGQGLFYLAALAGRRLGRPGALARTFVVLNAAAVVGLYRYLAGRHTVTW
ncbi:MAG: glycosyltransferase family 2 protein [Xanthomonadales bacterium]|jgi:cellulose synthase/poly-beta-1,6-N-acetylglucosamine synthase-like glycosyltransferase|nr:glycosyltransferase family 2 protein [Xanthomonadales bacterium]